jgi:cysteine synthase
MKKAGDKAITTEERRIKEAKSELDKYMFYFERFNNHDKAEKHARTLRPVIRAKI